MRPSEDLRLDLQNLEIDLESYCDGRYKEHQKALLLNTEVLIDIRQLLLESLTVPSYDLPVIVVNQENYKLDHS